MIQDSQLINQINQTPFLSPGDKSFLVENLPQMSQLDKLRLHGSLVASQAPAVLQSLQIMRAKFYKQEIPPKPNLIDKVSSMFGAKKTKKIVAQSILTQPQALGGPVPQAVRSNGVSILNNLSDYHHPSQLSLLEQKHVSFDLDVNAKQIVQVFLDKLDASFDQIENVNLRRGYFMNFIQSALFRTYINTTLTAIRHQELQPRKIVLNLLYQINSAYLNSKQFQTTAVITGHLRNLVGI